MKTNMKQKVLSLVGAIVMVGLTQSAYAGLPGAHVEARTEIGLDTINGRVKVDMSKFSETERKGIEKAYEDAIRAGDVVAPTLNKATEILNKAIESVTGSKSNLVDAEVLKQNAPIKPSGRSAELLLTRSACPAAGTTGGLKLNTAEAILDAATDTGRVNDATVIAMKAEITAIEGVNNRLPKGAEPMSIANARSLIETTSAEALVSKDAQSVISVEQGHEILANAFADGYDMLPKELKDRLEACSGVQSAACTMIRKQASEDAYNLAVVPLLDKKLGVEAERKFTEECATTLVKS